MTHSYGRFIIDETTIPALSTAEVLFRVFTAGEKAVSIQYIQYYGGDASESLQLFLIPANVAAAGLKPSGTAGTIAFTAGGVMRGNVGTVDLPATVIGEAAYYPKIVPPFCSIGASMSAGNTAAYGITIGGFEIDA